MARERLDGGVNSGLTLTNTETNPMHRISYDATWLPFSNGKTDILTPHERRLRAYFLRREVISQWYPASIADSNNDGIGDIPGMTRVLPEFLDGFPVSGIWNNPIFPSPDADFGYDVSKFMDIHPKLGTVEEFLVFKDEARRQGRNLIIDWVPNHVSVEHAWFVEARKSRDNSKRDYFIWRDGVSNTIPPNEAKSNAGGSAWEFDAKTGQYYLHMFLKEQPDLNWDNPGVRQEMNDIMIRMIDEWEVAGFRVDVADFIGKVVGFDGKFEIDKSGKIKRDLNKSLRYLKEMADAVCGRGKFLMLEVYPEHDKDRKEFFKVSEDGLAAPFNFDFIFKHDAWGSATAIKKNIEGALAGLRPQDTLIWVLGNHDQSRAVTRFGGEKQARLAALLQFTLPGIPVVYYGEEIGMHNVYVHPEKRIDKFQEEQEDGMFKDRSVFRTPFQLSDEPNAGFTDENIEPYLPIADDYKKINLRTERQDPTSMLSLYRKLRELKRADVLIHGGITFCEVGDDSVLAYIRQSDEEEIIVIINFSKDAKMIELPEIENAGLILRTSMDTRKEEKKLTSFVIEAEAGYIFAVDHTSRMPNL